MTPDEIRAAREALGLTPTQLARVLGYVAANPGRIVTGWEDGRPPHPVAATAITAFLDGWRPSWWEAALKPPTPPR